MALNFQKNIALSKLMDLSYIFSIGFYGEVQYIFNDIRSNIYHLQFFKKYNDKFVLNTNTNWVSLKEYGATTAPSNTPESTQVSSNKEEKTPKRKR